MEQQKLPKSISGKLEKGSVHFKSEAEWND
jgi:hypothetical protein